MNSTETLRFLKEDTSHFVKLFNTDSSTYIPADGGEKGVFIKDVPNEDLLQLIKNSIGHLNKDVIIYVEHRKQAGATSRMHGKPYKIEIKAISEPQVTQTPYTPTPTPSHVPTAHPYPAPNNYLGASGFGLGIPELVDMNVNKFRLAEIQNKFDELKEEHKELKQELRDQKNAYERKINEYDSDLKKANAELFTKEREKELAIKEIEAAKKTFGESPLAEKLLDSLTKIGEAYATKGGETAPASALGNPGSETKKMFFDLVNSNCTEEQVNYLGAIYHFINNPGFINELNGLVDKYNDQN